MKVPGSGTIVAPPQAGALARAAPAPCREAHVEPELAAHGRLKSDSVRGVIVNVGAEGGKFALRFGYQIIMVRLLRPADFGLVATAAPAITFVQMFADLGLTEATIQRKEITQAQLSFLFWVNFATGLILAVICVAASPFVAWFYREPRVQVVMVATGAMLVLGGLYSQHLALLTRHMRFRALAVLDLGSFAIGLSAGILAARSGAGYWSILIAQAVSSVAAIIIAWTISGWVPGRPGRVAEMKPLLHFGGNITAFRIMNFFSHSTDSILLGRFSGEYALGLYNRAFKITLLPFTQLCIPFTKVAVPLLSRSQDQPAFYRKAYCRMLEALLLLLYPGLIFMLLNSHTLVNVALGPRWAGVAPIFQWLGLDAFIAPLSYSMGWLFVSQGRTTELRDWSVPTSVLFVCAFAVGLRWGPEGIAAGYAAASFGEISYLWRVATRSGPLRGRDFWASLAPFLFCIATTCAVLAGVTTMLPGTVARLFVSLALAYATFTASLALFPRGRALLSELAWQASQRLPLLSWRTVGAIRPATEGQSS